MNKKGQLDYPLVMFAVLIVGLLILAPVMLKIFNEIKTPLSTQLGNLSGGAVAQTNFNYVMDVGINFWDEVMLVAFFIAIIILFVSAFMIDVHPFWVVLYIFTSFILILMAPNLIDIVDELYSSADFVTEIGQLTYMVWIKDYFAVILVGLMVISGIIIYGKIAYFGRDNGGRY